MAISILFTPGKEYAAIVAAAAATSEQIALTWPFAYISVA
jgi:hypothetical protein